MTVNTESSAHVSDWLKWVLTTSVPICRLDDKDEAAQFASGCLVDFYHRRFLLTAEHALKMGTQGWAIELRDNNGPGTEIWKLGRLKYAERADQDGNVQRELADFCFTEVPADLQSVYHYSTPRGKFDERPRHVFRTALNDKAVSDGIYAFAGRVAMERHGANVYVSEMVVYPGLRLERAEQDLYLFKLPVPHPGHEAFYGCSGAPIVDMNRTVVALLCGGDIHRNIVYGVSLARYRSALEEHCEGSLGLS